MGRLGYKINEKERTVIATKSGLQREIFNMFNKSKLLYPLEIGKKELLIPNRLSAVAKCHPVDAWDVEIGKTVARNRFNKMYKNIAKNAINKYIDKIQMHIKETQKVLNKLK